MPINCIIKEHLRDINGRLIPVGSVLHPERQLVDEVHEGAAARRLADDDGEAGHHLPQAGQQAAHITQHNADAVP